VQRVLSFTIISIKMMIVRLTCRGNWKISRKQDLFGTLVKQQQTAMAAMAAEAYPLMVMVLTNQV
jgi:hypothetical protein